MSRHDPQFQESLDLLSDSLSAYLRDNWNFNARRTAMASDTAWSPAIWNGLTNELGLLAAAECESLGGLGLGLAAQGAIAEVLGQNLALTPYLESAIMAAALLRDGGSEANALLRLSMEGTIIAPALYEPHSRYNPLAVQTRATQSTEGWTLSGHKRVVRAAPWAQALIVSAQTPEGLGLFILAKDTPGLVLTELELHDGPRAAEIHMDKAAALPIHAGSCAATIITRAVEEATYGLCAEAVGIMRRLTRSTHDYVRQRKQFGLPIGAFQALQFRLADMAMALEEAEAILPVTLEALTRADKGLRARAIAAAKLTIDRACETVGTGAIQLHGAIGLTDELDVSHAFKRSLMIQHELGDTHHHAAQRLAA